MDSSIAFISDVGVAWPPPKWVDPVVKDVKVILAGVSAADFTQLSMYFHLLGEEPNTFGMVPGVVLRRNRRENEMVATLAVSKKVYNERVGFRSKRISVVDGVVDVLAALSRKCPELSDQLAVASENLRRLRDDLQADQGTAT